MQIRAVIEIADTMEITIGTRIGTDRRTPAHARQESIASQTTTPVK
jgi:hypothetical protein